MSRFSSSFRNLFRRAEVDGDLEAEIQSHRQLLTDQNIAQGMDPATAHRQATLEMGGVEQVKEEVRSVRAGQWMEQLWQDVRYALRMLRKAPGFAALAVITLALGIGANTAMFSVVKGVLLQSPPFADPGHVVVVLQKQPNGNNNVFSTPDYLEWKRQASPVSQMAAIVGDSHTLGTGDQAERVNGWRASAEIFSVLGVSPAMGRPFTAEEDRPGAGRVVLLSDAFWKKNFHADPNVLGVKVTMDGAPFTVIGVLPPGFHIFGPGESYWTPLQLPTQDAMASSRTLHWLLTLARLTPESSVKQSQSAADAVATRLHHDDPAGDAGFGVTLLSYQDFTTGGLRGPLLLLMGCVGFVLLIACSNVANLLLARGTSRRLEMSIRAAVGAQRSRVLRQLLTESVMLSLLGGIAGLFLASGALHLLLAINPSSLPNVETIKVNGPVLAFTFAVCVIVGILFGIAPALATSRVDVSNALRETSRGGGRTGGKSRAALVVVETALAFILLIGAGLSLKSLWKVSHVDPGFNPTGLLTFKIAPSAQFKDQPFLFYNNVIEKIRALPGVETAVLARDVPLSGTDPSMPVAVDGGTPQVTDGQVVTRLRVVGPDYFRGFQTPLLRGREFTTGDTAASQPVVVVSQSLAQRYWPNQVPLGKTLKPNIADAPWYTVVGIAVDVRHQGLDADTEPTAYYPYTQLPKSIQPLAGRYMTIIVRGNTRAGGFLASIRHSIATVDSTVSIYALKTMDDYLSDAGSFRLLATWLIAVFAGLALILAAVGLYGVMAYAVNERTREIGIRMALGARRKDVLRMIVIHGMKMAVAGVAVGIIGAVALARLMADLVYETSTTDVPTFGVVGLCVMIFILLACCVPSLRATRVDPNMALRCE
ncbi:MAG TPA: ABC transporter permease [Candidatus Angelobacter sp.]|nr:ABC transporter permease [Candidatus Angelobacter sp.]